MVRSSDLTVTGNSNLFRDLGCTKKQWHSRANCSADALCEYGAFWEAVICDRKISQTPNKVKVFSGNLKLVESYTIDLKSSALFSKPYQCLDIGFARYTGHFANHIEAGGSQSAEDVDVQGVYAEFIETGLLESHDQVIEEEGAVCVCMNMKGSPAKSFCNSDGEYKPFRYQGWLTTTESQTLGLRIAARHFNSALKVACRIFAVLVFNDIPTELFGWDWTKATVPCAGVRQVDLAFFSFNATLAAFGN
jgi:hypothetical protein